MSEAKLAAEAGTIQLVRLPVDKPQAAVGFLRARSGGVMDLIAHFWERLPQTPPLGRGDLHLVVAVAGGGRNGTTHEDMTIQTLDEGRFTGAMLYVPKAHRADVLALDVGTAEAFAGYIASRGRATSDNGGAAEAVPAGVELPGGAAEGGSVHNLLTVHDLTGIRGGMEGAVAVGGGGNGVEGENGGANGGSRVAIDFLTGGADGVGWMARALLPRVHRKAPARELVNVVMQLPGGVKCEADEHVRLAGPGDVGVLNRWRRQYKEERGILFDADVDALVASERVFAYEVDKQIVALAKFDMELDGLMEIGGVYTFPEHRKKGYGGRIVGDLVCRARGKGKVPILQVDQENGPALKLYAGAGWEARGRLARVWLTG